MKNFYIAAIAAVIFAVSAQGQTTTQATTTTSWTIPTDTEEAYHAAQTYNDNSVMDAIAYTQATLSAHASDFTSFQIVSLKFILEGRMLAAAQYANAETVLQSILANPSGPEDIDHVALERGNSLAKQHKLADAMTAYSTGLANEKTTNFQPSLTGGVARMKFLQGDTAGATKTMTDFLTAVSTEIPPVPKRIDNTARILRDLYSDMHNFDAIIPLSDSMLNNPLITTAEMIQYWRGVKVEAYIRKGDNAGAIALIQSYPAYLGDAVVIRKLVKISSDTNIITNECVKMLSVDTPANMTADDMKVVASVIPGNDAANCMLLDAKEVVRRYKEYLRGQNGRLNNTQMASFVEQLQKGDGTKFLASTAQGRMLSAKLAATNAPLNDFFVPLFNGDYAGAAKAAFADAKAAHDDVTYKFYVSLLAGAVRANDQCYNNRAVDVIKYVNGETDTNPIADLLQ